MSLTENERRFLNHMMRWGSDGFPIRRVGRSWHVYEFCGIKGPPTTFRTKRDASAFVDRYLEILANKAAGRI